jgi:hypothetical protein
MQRHVNQETVEILPRILYLFYRFQYLFFFPFWYQKPVLFYSTKKGVETERWEMEKGREEGGMWKNVNLETKNQLGKYILIGPSI